MKGTYHAPALDAHRPRRVSPTGLATRPHQPKHGTRVLSLLSLLSILIGTLLPPATALAAPARQEPTAPTWNAPARPEGATSAEGETWFVTWTATGEGYYSGPYHSDDYLIRSHRLSMTGSAISRYSKDNGGTGWKTDPFKWTVTDDLFEEERSPCWGSGGSSISRQKRTIVAPNTPPLWVDHFVSPGPIFENDDGSKYMSGLWFVHSTEGMPWFPYQDDHYYQPCNDPATSRSETEEWSWYEAIIWWQSFGRFSNQVDLDCDDTGTTCWFDYAYVSEHYTDVDMPIQVNWTIRARRLPDSPSIGQEPELLERNVFLPGVPVSDRFDGNLSCDKQATCRAQRQLQLPSGAQSRETIGPAPSGNYPKTINLGDLPPGRSLLTAQAEGANPAPPDTKQILVAAKLPQWAADIAGIVARKVGNYVAYVWEVKFPEPAIKKLYDVPAIVPFIGGKKAGAELPQAGLKTEAKSTGEVAIEGATGGSLVLGDSAIGINIAGKANGILDLQGVRDVKGEAEFKVFGKVSAEEPLIKAVPALRPAVTAIDQFSPAVAKWLEDRAKAILEIEPSWSGSFGFSDKTGSIEIDNAVISPGIGIKVKAALKAYEGLLEAAVGVGGEVKAAFPTPPLELKEVAVNFVVMVEGVLMHFGFGAQAGYACVFPGSCATTGETAAADAGPVWRLLDRAYLDAPGYARWTAQESALSAATLAAVAADDVVDVQLVDNIYPQAHPALVRYGSQRVILWSHDAQGKPATGGQDLRFSRRTGSSNDTWTAPAAVTDDTVADFNRELVTTPGSRVVAVWQRFDSATPGDMNSDPQAYLSHVQIASSFWNGTTWSAPQQLSASGSTNNRPSLTAITGGAMAVWIGNSANQLIGDTTHPDTVYYATFADNPGTWTAATAVLTDVSGLLSARIAARGNNIAVVYTRDMDGDFGTDADREIFYTRYNNGWESLVRLTNNQVPDESPHLVWNKDGAPQLVWQQGDTLRFLNGSWNAAAAVSLPFSAPETPLRLVNDTTGGDKGLLALLWPHVTGVDTRVGYAVFDGAQNLWSVPQTLAPATTGVVTGTSTMVTHLSPALDGNRILLAYQVAEVGVSSVQVGGVNVPNVPTSGKHSLRYAEIPLTANPAISEADIVVTPLDAGPGETVTIHARVRNTGVLSSVAGEAKLIREPGTTLSTQTLPPIAGGDVVTVSFPYVQPSDTAKPLRVEVSVHWLTDANTRDNKARVVSAPLFETLAPLDTPIGPLVGARFRQQGALQGGIGFTATLHLDSINGPVVGEALAAFPDEPLTQVVTSTVALSPTQLGAGRHLIHWVGPYGALGASAVTIAADLALYPETVNMAGNQLMATVTNQGNVPNNGGALEVYDRDPTLAGAQLLQEFALPTIAPGKTANVGGIVGVAAADPTQPHALPPHVYVLLKPGTNSVDLNPANNLYVLGDFAGSGPTLIPAAYLPAVAR